MTGHYDKHCNFEAWQPASAKHRIKRSYPVNGWAPATDTEARALMDAAARAAARDAHAPLDDVRDPDPVVEVVAGAALGILLGGFLGFAFGAFIRWIWSLL